MLFFQGNDDAIRIRLGIFGSKATALLCTDYRTDWRGEGIERRGVPSL
jgi:hypothetical protein